MSVSSLTELMYAAAPAYWLVAIGYVAATKARSEWPARVATYALGGAVLLHVGEYVGRGALFGRAGGAPFTGVSGFLSIAALVLAVGYLVVERRVAGPALGAFAAPVVAALHTVSVALFREPTAVPIHLQGPHLVAHVSIVAAACVGLAAALVSGVTYLALDAMLRWKRSGQLFRKLPNLDAMSRVHRVALVAGANLLGVGALFGALWAKSVWGFYFDWHQPKLVITLGAFLAGNLCFVAWCLPRWHGRRAVWAGVATISTTFLALALAGAFANELHRFV